MDENNTSAISQATSLEAMGAFWDSHDFTDYDTDAPDVSFRMRPPIRIERGLLRTLEQYAQQRGVSVETLINIWLQQKASEEERTAA